MLRIKNVGLIMVAIILFLTPTIVFGASGYSSQSIKRVVVTFDAQEGNVSQTSKSVILNSTYGNLPVPTRNGYIFGGWYTGKSGSGTMILSATLVTNASNHTLYAKWVNNISSGGNGYSSLPNNPSSGESQGLKVFFNPNGGTVDTPSKSITYHSDYGTLPTPVREGFKFLGWYTSTLDDDETKVISSTVVTKNSNHTLYAHWKVDGDYTISLEDVEVACTYNDGKVITKSYDPLAAQIYATIGESSVRNSRELKYEFQKYELLHLTKRTSDIASAETSSYNELIAKNMKFKCLDTFYKWGISEYNDSTETATNTLIYFYAYGVGSDYSTSDYIEQSRSKLNWQFLWMKNKTAPTFLDLWGEEGDGKISDTVDLVSERISFINNVTPIVSATYTQTSDQASGTPQYLTISYHGDVNGDPILYVSNGEVTTSINNIRGYEFSTLKDSLIDGTVNLSNRFQNVCVKDSVESMSDNNTTISSPRIDIYAVKNSYTPCKEGYTHYGFSFMSSKQESGSNITEVCASIPEVTKVLVRIIVYLQIIVPALLIIYTAIDIGRIVLAGNIEEELPKKKKAIMIRFIVVIAFFFIPLIIRVIFNQAYIDPNTKVGGIDCLFEKAETEANAGKDGDA